MVFTYNCSITRRLWLLYVDFCITSHQAKNIQACSRGVLVGKCLFPPCYPGCRWSAISFTWNLNLETLGREETSWSLFPIGLVLCKCIQARLVDWHVSILEIQDRAVYSNDPTIFWQWKHFDLQEFSWGELNATQVFVGVDKRKAMELVCSLSAQSGEACTK